MTQQNQLAEARPCKQLFYMQTLRRRIDLLSKQKSDIRTSLVAAKSSCEGKADDNEFLKAQIKVSLSCTAPPRTPYFPVSAVFHAPVAHFPSYKPLAWVRSV